ncbi:hypothetical protein ABZ297_31140 [Nonomuraea sp. NPDC005983]|uniref:hypothetical protein n=1 Tax=Nonomuraea sp. NPDC005983 TaxID=3155595 RepID=UPI0033BE59B7
MNDRRTTAQKRTPSSSKARHHRPMINLPVLGPIPVPEGNQLAFYAVLGILGALEIVEWPVVLIVGVGHLLSSQHRFRLLQQLGQAAEAA